MSKYVAFSFDHGGNRRLSHSSTNSDDLIISGKLTLSKAATDTELVVTGNTTIGGTLGVTGNTTVGGTMTLNDNVSVTGSKTLTVGTGATTLGGTLGVTGNTTVDGNIRATQLQITSSKYFEEDTVNRGTVFLNDGRTNQWKGINVDSEAAFMWYNNTNGTREGGIYSTRCGDWLIHCNNTSTSATDVSLRCNDVTRLQTTTSGVTVTGTVTATTFSGGLSGNATTATTATTAGACTGSCTQGNRNINTNQMWMAGGHTLYLQHAGSGDLNLCHGGGDIKIRNSMNLNHDQIWKGGTLYLQHSSGSGNLHLCNAGGTVEVMHNMTVGGTITGSLSGNATSVTNGVYTTGTQSIGGTKTMTSEFKLQGVNSTSHFNYSTNQEVYIRAGKIGHTVFINDSHHGPVRICGGEGTLIVSGPTELNGSTITPSNSSWTARYHGSGHGDNAVSATVAYSLKTAKAIWAGTTQNTNPYDAGIWIGSDQRIKNNVEDVVDDSALVAIRNLNPKKYNYISGEGLPKVYGFIAQEVKAVIPEAVSVGNINFIPNIWERANITFSDSSKTGSITLINGNTSELSVDVEVQLFKIDDKSRVIKVTGISNSKTFSFSSEDFKEQDIEVIEGVKWTFVHGMKVNDFHIMKKDTIWTVATAALQEVDRQLQAEKAKVATLETTVAQLLARVTALEGN